MAISGEQIIAVGLQNEAPGSDSLYTAFNKTVDNFATLFAQASPYSNFANGVGIDTNLNANTSTVTITNTGVTNIIAGTNISIDSSNGNVTISSSGGGNGNGGGTVTSVGVTSSTLSVGNSPVVSSGNITVNLPITGVTPGAYINPTVTVDTYGRVTNIANNAAFGTVTSVGLTSNSLTISNSPVTTSGVLTVDLPSNITASRFVSNVSTGTAPFTVTSTTQVANLNVATAGTVTTAAQPNITSIGTLTSLSVTGNITGSNINGTFYGAGTGLTNIPGANILGQVTYATTANGVAGGNVVGAVNLATYATTANSIAGANVSGAVAYATTANAVAGANVSGTVANATYATSAGTATSATSATTAGTVTTASQPNITSVGTLTSLILSTSGGGIATGNANITAGNVYANTGTVGANLVTANYFNGNGSQLTGISGPIFMAYNSVAQNIPTGSSTMNLIYSTTTVNTGSYYNTSTGIYTPLVPGYYQINVCTYPVGGTFGSFFLGIYKNGAAYASGTGMSIQAGYGQPGISTASVLVYLNGTTDNINCKLISTSVTGSWSTIVSTTIYFQAVWVRS